jgi:phosphorylcholine metabolism protein LicD
MGNKTRRKRRTLRGGKKKHKKTLAIKDYLVLSQKDVNLLYDITKKTVSILNKNDVTFWATDGTLLGIKRSKGFIPWDDDVDLAIDSKDKTKLRSLKDNFKTVGLELVGVGKYMKVKVPTNKNVWIDIFILKNGVWPQSHYSDIAFEAGELYPLKKGKFGPITIPIPNQSSKYLDRIFKGWRKIAYIYNHHTKGKKKISFIDYPELKKPMLPT